MIITELYHGQGFGNQLFAYVTTRMLAHNLGYGFGISGRENLGDRRFNTEGVHFMDLDLGCEVIGGSSPPGGPPTELPESIKHHYFEYRHGNHTDLRLKTDIRLTDKNLFLISDNTKIDGLFQSEDYFYDKLDLVKEWLKVKPDYEHTDTYGDDICIINFRGSDMIGNAGCWLPRSYYDNAIKAMVAHNPKMEFAIVTEDVKTANQVLPGYPAYHESVAWDFVAIKNAKYVICGASTFACWPLWLSETLEYCIAPKYWFDFNRSQGWWSLGCSIYSYPSHYMDRSGNLFTPDECRVEWEEYKKTSNIYEGDL